MADDSHGLWYCADERVVLRAVSHLRTARVHSASDDAAHQPKHQEKQEGGIHLANDDTIIAIVTNLQRSPVGHL